MAIQIANMAVGIQVDDKQAVKKLESFQNRLKKSVRRSKALLKMLAGGLGATAVFFRGWRLAAESIELANTQIQAQAKLQGVLDATGHAAGRSGKQLFEMANSMQEASTLGDEEIIGAMAKMATFKNVQGKVFDDAMQAALDLAHVGFGSIEQASVQMGKALEDPVQGVSALKRVGVSIMADDQKRITALYEQGRLVEAQEVLLKAVKDQVDGVAAGVAATDAGKLQIINNKLNDMKEVIGAELIPVILALKTWWHKVLQDFVIPIAKTMNFVVNNWEVTFELMKAIGVHMFWNLVNEIYKTILTIPDFFKMYFGTAFLVVKEYFLGMGEFAVNFGKTIITVFKNVGKVIYEALTGGDVQSALEDLKQDFVQGMGETVAGIAGRVDTVIEGGKKNVAEYMKARESIGDLQAFKDAQKNLDAKGGAFGSAWAEHHRKKAEPMQDMPNVGKFAMQTRTPDKQTFGGTDLLGLASQMQDKFLGPNVEQKQLDALEKGNDIQGQMLEMQQATQAAGGQGSLE